MKFEIDKIEYVETYREYKIVINHNYNKYYNVKKYQDIIYYICGLSRVIKGSIVDVKNYIDCVLDCEEW